MGEFVKLVTSSSININRIAALLNKNNIPSMVKDNVESARVAGLGISQNSVEPYVNSSDLERAQKIPDAFNAEK